MSPEAFASLVLAALKHGFAQARSMTGPLDRYIEFTELQGEYPETRLVIVFKEAGDPSHRFGLSDEIFKDEYGHVVWPEAAMTNPMFQEPERYATELLVTVDELVFAPGDAVFSPPDSDGISWLA